MSADGSNKRRIATDVWGFAWSPSGLRLAFVHAQGIWIVSADGRGKQRLASRADNSYVVWSPDGKTVAFSARARPTLVRADGGKPRLLTGGGASVLSTQLTWSPNGHLIAFEEWDPSSLDERTYLYVIHPDGGDLRPVPVNIQDAAPRYTWSPDGRLIIGSNPGVGPYPLIEVDVDGSHARRLTQIGNGS